MTPVGGDTYCNITIGYNTVYTLYINKTTENALLLKSFESLKAAVYPVVCDVMSRYTTYFNTCTSIQVQISVKVQKCLCFKCVLPLL